MPPSKQKPSLLRSAGHLWRRRLSEPSGGQAETQSSNRQNGENQRKERKTSSNYSTNIITPSKCNHERANVVHQCVAIAKSSSNVKESMRMCIQRHTYPPNNLFALFYIQVTKICVHLQVTNPQCDHCSLHASPKPLHSPNHLALFQLAHQRHSGVPWDEHKPIPGCDPYSKLIMSLSPLVKHHGGNTTTKKQTIEQWMAAIPTGEFTIPLRINPFANCHTWVLIKLK